MFSIYYSVCLRSIIARLVPEKDKGSAAICLSEMHRFPVRQSIQFRGVDTESRRGDRHDRLREDLPSIDRLLSRFGLLLRSGNKSYCPNSHPVRPKLLPRLSATISPFFLGSKRCASATRHSWH